MTIEEMKEEGFKRYTACVKKRAVTEEIEVWAKDIKDARLIFKHCADETKGEVVQFLFEKFSVEAAKSDLEMKEGKMVSKQKYNEIFKLKGMLEKAAIPFDFSELHGGFHIVYPCSDDVVCSAIEHDFSYGCRKDLLEIRGLMTEKEIQDEDDDVLGFLTAQDVFNRIEKHYKNEEA